MNNRKLQIWLPVLFAVVMIGGMYLGYRLRENTAAAGSFFRAEKRTPLQEVVDLIRLKYVDPIDIDTLGDNAIREMLLNLDPHSTFIPAVKLKDENANLAGRFEGIGVEFQLFSDTVNIVNVIKNGPSDKAGLQAGDKILKAGDAPLAGRKLRADDIKEVLRGQRGSPVEVTLLRKDSTFTTTIVRGPIALPSVDAAYMITPETGFIRISKFAEPTYEEFMRALETLQGKGLKKLILDLRGNGGGLMQEAVDIADEFLDGDKLIVYTEGSKVPRQEYRARRPGLFEKGDLVLLMDESSASASEVLAGALQDWDRATIIGRRSFGKGLVQEQYQLSGGSALRITVARYYTPMGRSIQKPYDQGVRLYHEELNERYLNGSLLTEDTAHADSEEFFTTKGGKKLYGGGGITPDIFIPIDTATAHYPAVLNELYYRGTLSNFVYTYYISNRNTLDTLSSPAQLIPLFENDNSFTDRLLHFARKDDIIAPPLNTAQRRELQKRIRNMLGRQIWRTEGYFELNNTDDPAVLRAVALLNGTQTE